MRFFWIGGFPVVKKATYDELEHQIKVLKKDAAERKQSEEVLKLKEKELEVKTGNLEEINTALTVLLKKRDEDKLTMQKQVLSNVKNLVIPYIEKLKQYKFNGTQITNLEL